MQFAKSLKQLLGIALSIACLKATAHELEETSTSQQKFELNSFLYVDTRWLDTKDYTPLLPLAGVNNIPIQSPLFGQSRVGLQGVYHDDHPVDFNLSLAYSDLDKKMMLDHANVGMWLTPKNKLTAGRMNPLPHYKLDSWPIADLLTMAISGSDHWHAEGAMFGHLAPSWQAYGGVFLPQAYPGGMGGGFSHSLYTTGFKWQAITPLHFKFDAGYLDQAERSLIPTGTHTHTTDISNCGSTLNCVKVHAGWATAGLTYAPQWQQWQPKADVYGLWKKEKGTLLNKVGNQNYKGDLTGWIVQLSLKHSNQPWKIAARYERLGIDHFLTGDNASLVAQQAGWLANTLSPYRYGIKLEYAIKPWLIPYVGYIYDDAVTTTNNRESQHFTFLGLIVDWRYFYGNAKY